MPATSMPAGSISYSICVRTPKAQIRACEVWAYLFRVVQPARRFGTSCNPSKECRCIECDWSAGDFAGGVLVLASVGAIGFCGGRGICAAAGVGLSLRGASIAKCPRGWTGPAKWAGAISCPPKDIGAGWADNGGAGVLSDHQMVEVVVSFFVGERQVGLDEKRGPVHM